MGPSSRADVDGHVIQREGRIAPRAIVAIQLAHQCAGIALEQSGAQHDDAQSEQESAAAAGDCQDHVSQRDQRAAPEDGGLRAQQPVRDPATGHGRNVDRRSVKTVDGRGGAVVNPESAVRHLVHQEQQQQRAHAVVAEALPHLGEEEGGKTGGMTEEIARRWRNWLCAIGRGQAPGSVVAGFSSSGLLTMTRAMTRPSSYSSHMGTAISVCEIGSGGVSMAAMTKMPMTT